MFKGQNLYNKAKKLIPGGTMLLSKRPEMFLPDLWPSYFNKAIGCEVWDLDGVKYFDCSTMSVGTNSLGYSNNDVDTVVNEILKLGNMSTLNCPEEVLLAERLIEINPWADMVRFARTGGEANSVAIRIARAASGNDKIAICGYHGWHDWYLSANHNNGNDLSNHLLSGLNPVGVPKDLENTVFPFNYNDIDYLKKIIEEHKIGIIKMEVVRNIEPKGRFLDDVRQLATKKGIVLIFDECTSGFRETFGGIHQKFNVEPDIAMYGKALGNGYAITAVVGKRSVMEAAQKTFISSTFWTERIGPTAALKTLEIMEREKSWETITALGNYMQGKWKFSSKKHEVNIKISGLPSISSFSFENKDAQKFKTYLTQEFLKKGYLATTSFYASTAHTHKVIDNYSEVLDEIFFNIKKCIVGELNIDNLLDSKIAHNGFQRLN